MPGLYRHLTPAIDNSPQPDPKGLRGHAEPRLLIRYCSIPQQEGHAPGRNAERLSHLEDRVKPVAPRRGSVISAADYSSRASTLSPGPGARRSACAGLQEPQLPPRVLSSQQPPLPPREENLLTTRGLRTTTPSKHRAASLSAPSTGHAGALGSVNKPGWRRLDTVPYGICSFFGVSWAVSQRDKDYKSRRPQRDEPGHVAGGRPGVRAAVDPVLQ